MFRRSKKYISKFSETLKYIRENMHRPLIENTAYEMHTQGGKPKDNTTLQDMLRGCPYKYHNPLFSFMLFVNKGDVTDRDIAETIAETADENLPCITILLNYAIIMYAQKTEKGIGYTLHPWISQAPDSKWHIMSYMGQTGIESVEGNHLGIIYFFLLEHLSRSLLKLPDLRPYIKSILCGKLSKTIGIERVPHKNNQ
jgi:hypothetical protein